MLSGHAKVKAKVKNFYLFILEDVITECNQNYFLSFLAIVLVVVVVDDVVVDVVFTFQSLISVGHC